MIKEIINSIAALARSVKLPLQGEKDPDVDEYVENRETSQAGWWHSHLCGSNKVAELLKDDAAKCVVDTFEELVPEIGGEMKNFYSEMMGMAIMEAESNLNDLVSELEQYVPA